MDDIEQFADTTEGEQPRIKSRYKSGARGPRDYKLTIPLPSSLMDDVKDICAMSGTKPSDLINSMLEQYVKDNAKTLEIMRAGKKKAGLGDGQ